MGRYKNMANERRIEEMVSFVSDVCNPSKESDKSMVFSSKTSRKKKVSKIINYIKQMDDDGKELSLGLVSQVAQHRGNNDGN